MVGHKAIANLYITKHLDYLFQGKRVLDSRIFESNFIENNDFHGI